jgi:mannose-6-phosphate isomerase
MKWYPLKLTSPIRRYTFGDRMIPRVLKKANLPEGRIAETWEYSDEDSAPAMVVNGPLAGTSLRELVMEHPDELVGEGWRGPHFPLLGKFLDATHTLPVHLHADDEKAKELYGAPNGKTEAWHILACPEEGATVLAGARDGVTNEDVRQAALDQDYDCVLRRLPIHAGDTVYVPGGTLHTVGPDTLVFEIQQTSDLAESLMPTDNDDRVLPPEEWRENIEATLRCLRLAPQPNPTHGLNVMSGNNRCTYCAAGPYFMMQRWKLTGPLTLAVHPDQCLALSNLVEPVSLVWPGGTDLLGRAESCIIPAATGQITIVPNGLAYVLATAVPNLARDVVKPLREAGHSDAEIATLGDLSSVLSQT